MGIVLELYVSSAGYNAVLGIQASGFAETGEP